MNKSIFTLTSALALAASQLVSAITSIDVMAVYTPGVASTYNGDPVTRINQLFALTNQIYLDSGVNLELRLVKALMVDYTDDNTASTALNDITNGLGAFSAVAALRQEYKADMVVLYRPYKTVQGGCGLAWVNGANTNGNFSAPGIKNYMYAHLAINTCGDYVTAHEMGHNMGLRHSRKQDGSGGTFPYALGHGVDGQFVTIMAYQSSFNVDYWTGKAYKFSNPALLCKNLPCGVDRNDTVNGADASYTLNITGPQIANFYGSSSAATSSSAVAESSSSAQSGGAKRKGSAKEIYDTALKAVNANQQEIDKAQKALAESKAYLADVSATAASAKQAYSEALLTFTRQLRFVEQQNAVIEQLQATRPTQDAAQYQARLSTLMTHLEADQKLAVAGYNAAISSQARLTSASGDLASALNRHKEAQKALADAQAQTPALSAALQEALANYRSSLL
jgi:peptidyl-Asp metalloendopeptidase